jgi:hypothetical protein
MASGIRPRDERRGIDPTFDFSLDMIKLLQALSGGSGTQYLNVGEPGKIRDIKCEKALYAVHVHACNQPGVVDLNANDVVFDDQPLPFCVCGGGFWEQGQNSLKPFDLRQSLRGRETKAVVGHRARYHVPEFEDVLRREIYRLAGLEEAGDALYG